LAGGQRDFFFFLFSFSKWCYIGQHTRTHGLNIKNSKKKSQNMPTLGLFFNEKNPLYKWHPRLFFMLVTYAQTGQAPSQVTSSVGWVLFI